MTERRSSRQQNPSSGREGSGKKARRVSQRRELAIVTLGAVAAMTGLGGVLAANPPSWATSAANAQPAITIQAPTTSSQPIPAQATARPSFDTERNSDEDDQATAQQQANQQAARRAAQQAAVQQSAPVYSAPAQAPAAAVSQGS